MNNKDRKALYFIKEFSFLKNPHIPIPHKRMLFSTLVIGQVFVLCTSTWFKEIKKTRRYTDTS